VTKADLLDAVWPETHVTEAVLTVAIGQLREVLGDDTRRPRFIETVHRRGYRWIGTLAATADGRTVELPLSTQHPELSTPIVGRDEALAEIEAAFARACAGQRQLVFVTGEPGIGKTALVDAFIASVTAARPTVRIGRGQCVDAYGAGEAYMPVLEALDALVRSPHGNELIAVLRRYAPTWLVQIPGVLASHELDELRRSLAASTSDRMIRELLAASEVLGAEVPAIFVVEDLHWSDHATNALLAAFAVRREAVKLMVLATYRPVDAVVQSHPIAALKRELAAKRLCTEIALDGLDESAVSQYLSARFPTHSFPSELSASLQSQSGGNPLFLINAVDDFVQRGWLREKNGGWECAVPPEAILEAVPEGTRQMIESRLDQVPPDNRDFLEAASIIGTSFSTQSLAAAMARDAVEVERECSTLARLGRFLERGRDLRWPDGSEGTEYGFRHALYRQVLREYVEPTRRQLLHRRIAERMEAGYGNDTPEVAGPLALHFELGGDLIRAVRYLRQAAAVAESRFAHREAIEHLRHGLALLDGIPSTEERDSEELAIQVALISPVFAAGSVGTPDVGAIAERIRTLTDKRATSIEVLQGLGSLLTWHSARGELIQAQAVCEYALQRCTEVSGSDIFVAITRGRQGLFQCLCGNPTQGIENIKESTALPDMLPMFPVELGITATADAGFCWCVLGQPLRGLEMARGALRRAVASKHPPTLGYVAGNLLRMGVLLGDNEVVQETAAAIGEISERFQVIRWQGLSQIGAGWVGLESGDAAAVDLIRRGRQQLLDLSFHLYQPFYIAMEATALIRCTLYGDAELLLSDTLAAVGDRDERWCEAELHRLRGEVMACSTNPSDQRRRGTKRAPAAVGAEQCFRNAIELARSQQAKWWELRACVSLARLLRAQRRRDEAREALSGAFAGFSEGFDLPDLRQAKQLLD
jgi:hypothetical protein